MSRPRHPSSLKLFHDRCRRRIVSLENHQREMETQLVELADCEEKLANLRQA